MVVFIVVAMDIRIIVVRNVFQCISADKCDPCVVGSPYKWMFFVQHA